MQQLPKKPNNIMEFGVDFQQQLIAEIIINRSFGLQIVDLIVPDYFKNQYFGFIIKLIKEYYGKHEVIPNYIGLGIEIDATYNAFPEILKVLKDTLEGIRTCEFNNQNVSEIALKFCKFQSVRNTVDEVKKKLDGGYYDKYDEIEDQIRKSVAFKEDDEGIDFFTGLERALDDDYREPIATGIAGIDEITNGGLGKGELGVVIAPLGVGKTTFLSIIGSNAYKAGKNVLHIFFEDKLDEVRRKYLTHWSQFPLKDLNANRDAVLRIAAELKADLTDVHLVFQKLKADETNIAKLRRVIKRERSKLGGKLDLIIIDYADCIVGEQSKDAEEWTGEGRTMRQLEGMAEEFNVALWTAVQGGRKSTTASLVEVDMMGGNIKKAQVAHFIMSIAKTLTQKDTKLATIAILKSRFGDDGKVFENCPFDNSRMHIDTTVVETLVVFEDNKAHRQVERVRGITQSFRADSSKYAVNTNNEPKQ